MRMQIAAAALAVIASTTAPAGAQAIYRMNQTTGTWYANSGRGDEVPSNREVPVTREYAVKEWGAADPAPAPVPPVAAEYPKSGNTTFTVTRRPYGPGEETTVLGSNGSHLDVRTNGAGKITRFQFTPSAKLRQDGFCAWGGCQP